MKELRIPPENASAFCWQEFTMWANVNGVGTDTEDWMPWWDCWSFAVMVADEQPRMS